MAAKDPFEQLKALDLTALSEEGRQSALVEVRTQIAALSSRQKDVAGLARRITLLKIWQQLVRLRIEDVKAEVPPPFVKTSASRMFPDAEPEVADTPVEEAAHESVEAPHQPEGDGFVMVRLLEAGVVRGMKLPAGITIETSQEDADNLVDSGKAIKVGPAEQAQADTTAVNEVPTSTEPVDAGETPPKAPAKRKSKKIAQS